MRVQLAAFVLAGSLVSALLIDTAAEGASSCLGRHATIVSNAKRIVGTRAPDVIVAGGRSNVIDGMGGNDRICGGGGGDKIDGDTGSDRISGGGGGDTITGFRGRDKISGGGGDDKIDGGAGTDKIDGGGGTDKLVGGSGNETMTGGPGDGDIVDEGQGDGNISGGGGDFDIVIGGPGKDRIDGGPGSHDIASYATSDIPIDVDLSAGIATGAAKERLSGIEDALGGAGNDTLKGSGAPNRLDGGPGDDHLTAVGSGDDAFGGQGSDTCSGHFASENSCGRESTGREIAVDLVRSIDGTSTLAVDGRGVGDQVTVSHSPNHYTVSSQDPIAPASQGGACASQGSSAVVCTGDAGSILAAMGGGNDTITLTGIPSRTSTLLDGGIGSDTLSGGSGHDVLLGGDDNDPDVLNGAGGNDTLFGINTTHPKKESGAATMSGGEGSDLLIGGQPCEGDVFDGGPGRNDSASFSRVKNAGITVNATIGGAVSDPDARACNNGRIDSSVEKIEGSSGPDILTGDNGNNDLLGRGGNDALDGAGGFDRCIGGGGHDRATNCEVKGSL